MSEEPERIPFQPPSEPPEKTADDHRRDFNPMKTYFELAILIFGAYALYYILGLEVLIFITLAVLIYIFRETYYVLDYYSYGFARKAAIFNAVHATAWFIVFIINAYSTLQFGYPLIWPEFEALTQTSPLFVLTAAFGSRNIIRMYKPSDEMILAKKRNSSGIAID